MIRLVSFSKVVIMVSLVCFCGCRPAQQVQPRETNVQDADTDVQLRFNPIDLPADKQIVPEEHPLAIGMVHNPVIVSDDSVEYVEAGDREVAVPDEIIDSLNNQTFRVQLLTAKVYGEARHAAIVAEEIFDRPVHLDYEVPYFKVRVGKFYDRDEAEQYLQKVKAAGYRNAWVVMAVSKRKQAPPMYLDDGYQHIEDSLDFIESDDTSNE